MTNAKQRPCLVLAHCDSQDDFLVAFITSATGVLPSTRTVTVDSSHTQWERTGLKRPSSIRVDKLTTLHVSVISGAIGVLPEDLVIAVREKLRTLLCLDVPFKR